MATVDETMREILRILRHQEVEDYQHLLTIMTGHSAERVQRAFDELVRLRIIEGIPILGGYAEPRLSTAAIRALEAGADPLTHPTYPHQHIVQNFHNSTIGGNIAAGANIVQRSRNKIRGHEVFVELREAIQRCRADESERKKLHAAVSDMESSVGTDGFVQHYQTFMAFASDHIQVFGSLLPALAMLLR